MTQQTKASILLAHGSRDPLWQAPLETISQIIQQQVGQDEHPVTLAYMELCQPSLLDICQQYAEQGYDKINIYPLFFAAGRHLRHDVPKQLADIESKLNIITILHPPIGQDHKVQAAIAQVIAERL